MLMLKNKRSWLRILEAVIAVLIVLSFVLLIYSRQNSATNREEAINQWMTHIKDYLSKDDAVRNSVLANDIGPINVKLREILPAWLNFSSRICSAEEICSNPAGFPSASVIPGEIVIFANLTYHPENASILKIFLWENG
jgi:hypothetical protein